LGGGWGLVGGVQERTFGEPGETQSGIMVLSRGTDFAGWGLVFPIRVDSLGEPPHPFCLLILHTNFWFFFLIRFPAKGWSFSFHFDLFLPGPNLSVTLFPAMSFPLFPGFQFFFPFFFGRLATLVLNFFSPPPTCFSFFSIPGSTPSSFGPFFQNWLLEVNSQVFVSCLFFFLALSRPSDPFFFA